MEMGYRWMGMAGEEELWRNREAVLIYPGILLNSL